MVARTTSWHTSPRQILPLRTCALHAEWRLTVFPFRVRHTCCGRQLNGHDSVPGHDGNDCFVYELPDGTASEQHKADVAARRKIHSVDWSEFTVLQNAQQIPEQFDGYVGYRMRLFMLRNKSPPTLIVKAIERVR